MYKLCCSQKSFNFVIIFLSDISLNVPKNKKVVENYPQIQIGYVVAKINVTQTDAFIESIKKRLLNYLSENNITEKNYSAHPQITGWRNVFKDMGVSHKTNRSSVEALVRRIVSGSKMWSISNVVDLYNCCSVLSILPMGGYDIDLINKNITLRFVSLNVIN